MSPPDDHQLFKQTNHERPDPFATRPLQTHQHYYESVRRRVPLQYSSPCQQEISPTLRALPIAACMTAVSDSRLLTFPTKAADWAHATSTPDTAWPVSGLPPDLSRNLHHTPVSMSSVRVSMLRQWSSYQSPPDASRTPFPHRSPRQSSANAAWGSLKPPSAGRLRRALLHLSYSIASRDTPQSVDLFQHS